MRLAERRRIKTNNNGATFLAVLFEQMRKYHRATPKSINFIRRDESWNTFLPELAHMCNKMKNPVAQQTILDYNHRIFLLRWRNCLCPSE
jgi:hypothetical protein